MAGLLLAAVLSVVFWQSASEAMLLVTGFLMFFCMQTGTNAMLIYTAEVFPPTPAPPGRIALGVSKAGPWCQAMPWCLSAPARRPSQRHGDAAVIGAGAG